MSNQLEIDGHVGFVLVKSANAGGMRGALVRDNILQAREFWVCASQPRSVVRCFNLV